MNIQRTRNATRNIFFDGMLKMVNMVIPFIMRSIMLNTLGVQYLGLSGLFKSILSFLNLAELGVGSAMVFSMYRPIAEDDEASICALLRLYRTFYRCIGSFIGILGLMLTPFLRDLIHGELPADMNLYILYFMNLGNTVLTYWLFAYKRSLLDAHQRRDVGSKVGLVVRLIEYSLKIITLFVLKNYYVYLAIQLLSQVCINILTAAHVDRMFPRYTPRGALPKEKVWDIVRRVRDLFTAKFSFVIFNSADTLVISSFMGLVPLAIYQNYYFIISSLQTMVDVVIMACIAGVGNSLVTESEEKNYHDLERISLLFAWIIGLSTAMLMCMYQPFMHIWMGPESLLSFKYVICCGIYYYSMGIYHMVNMFKDAAGIWRKDRWRPLVGALVNLGLNLATVRWLGLYGVLLSSVFSILVVQIPWLLHNLFDEVFPRKYLCRYVRFFLVYVMVGLVCCSVSCGLCSLIHLSPWPSLIINGIISFIAPNCFFFAVYGKNPLFKDTLRQILHVILGKCKKQ